MDLNKLLSYSVDSGASDLHLSVGSIPMVRIDGKMQTLQLSPLKNEEMNSIKNDVLNDNQKKILEDRLEIDFSYQIKDKGRLLVRPSGTEPKVRIMCETSNLSLMKKCVDLVKKTIH